MSSEKSLCTSVMFEDGAEQRITCTREPEHGGVHVGTKRVDEGQEVVQWTTAQAASVDEPVDDLPVWYRALPLDTVVEIHSRGGGYSNVLLTGAVLDNDEQIEALRISWRNGDENLPRHALVPWHAVSSIEWSK